MNWHLFTYSIKYDTGYAPNPFYGVCTLNTCKPQIRREANEGDWVVALKRDQVICIMKITKKMTMDEYWHHCSKRLPNKIPPQSGRHRDPFRLVGDCQYDFSSDDVKQLKGIHDLTHMQTDLSGKNALLSKHFVYFGDNGARLPKELLSIAKYANGHWIGEARKSHANNPYRAEFERWAQTLPCSECAVLGQPTDNRFPDEKNQECVPTNVCGATLRRPHRC